MHDRWLYIIGIFLISGITINNARDLVEVIKNPNVYPFGTNQFGPWSYYNNRAVYISVLSFALLLNITVFAGAALKKRKFFSVMVIINLIVFFAMFLSSMSV